MRGFGSVVKNFFGTKGEENENAVSPPLSASRSLRVEFEIRRDMAGKVIGTGGSTVRSIKERSGAFCYVHEPDQDDPRTYAEVKGSVQQVEKAYEELVKVVATIDEEFARQMRATITVKAKAGPIEGLMAKRGEKVKELEKDTGTSIRIEPQEKGRSYRCVRIVGLVRAVEMALPLVQECVELAEEQVSTAEARPSPQEKGPKGQFNPKRGPTESSIPHETERNMQSRPKTKQTESLVVPPDRAAKMQPKSKFKPPVLVVQKTESSLESSPRKRNEKNQGQPSLDRSSHLHHQDTRDSVDVQEILRTMTANVTVWARPEVFKCLIGAKGANIRKIKSECAAKITVEDHKEVEDFQHAYISGSVENVMIATQKVKESLEWYDPRRESQPRNKKQNSSGNPEDLKVIMAKAFVKIVRDASGFIIGKGGSNIKRIVEKTKADVQVDKEIDGEGFKKVHISGEVAYVLAAIEEVKNSMRGYKPEIVRTRTKPPSMRDQTRETISQKPTQPPSAPTVRAVIPSGDAKPVSTPLSYIQGSDGKIYIRQADGSLLPTHKEPIQGSDGKIYMAQADGSLLPIQIESGPPTQLSPAQPVYTPVVPQFVTQPVAAIVPPPPPQPPGYNVSVNVCPPPQQTQQPSTYHAPHYPGNPKGRR